MNGIEIKELSNEKLLEYYGNHVAQYAHKDTKARAKVIEEYEKEILRRMEGADSE